MEFQGKRYKWLPYYGGSNKCELNCIPKGENFYYRHKNAVLDGTPCEPGRRDICVEGVCKTVGCDNVLDSSKKEDRCLVCGGDGSTCYEVKGSYDAPTLSKGMFFRSFYCSFILHKLHVKSTLLNNFFKKLCIQYIILVMSNVSFIAITNIIMPFFIVVSIAGFYHGIADHHCLYSYYIIQLKKRPEHNKWH
ncbi:hypothetical protein AB205_0169080 [Aquarana catesbeiana]|uniref:ADAMTS/ADAMTS-like cysteine-rich domain-containing protein n=1 Tax=Aquarana catesbeiana TaxID=8400 RepID=A0A2G9SC44_AQUCT|nr:hypothetical protein AB205_0169080 [Aquarana catesbeiana]